MGVKPVIAVGIGVLARAARVHAAEPPARSSDALANIVRGLDSAVFDSFNRCSDPAQLARHAAYFAEDVECYHDNGGVTWDRDDMPARTCDNARGTYRREPVTGTLDVHPITGFGAIATGTHRFWAGLGQHLRRARRFHDDLAGAGRPLAVHAGAQLRAPAAGGGS